MAAPTLHQKAKANNGSGGSSVACSFSATPLQNSLIVVLAVAGHTDYGTDPGTISCSDNQGNTYTSRASSFETAIGIRCTLFTALAATSSGTFTVTASTGSGTHRWSIAVCEVRGYEGTGPVEKSGGATSGTYGPASEPWSPLNFTATTAAEQLFIGALGYWHGYDRTFTSGTGWTYEDGYNGNNAYPGLALISKAVTSTGTYDPEWSKTAGGYVGCCAAAISIVAGSDGNPAGNNDLASSATAGATASATLAVQRNLAAAAVAGALASGALSINRALTGAAIGAALGSATLTAFSSVWRIPTNAPNGTAVHATVFSGASPTYAILAQGTAIVAGGFVDIPGTGTIGAKAFAFVHNYSDNTATTNIRGGPAIATLTSL